MEIHEWNDSCPFFQRKNLTYGPWPRAKKKSHDIGWTNWEKAMDGDFCRISNTLAINAILRRLPIHTVRLLPNISLCYVSLIIDDVTLPSNKCWGVVDGMPGKREVVGSNPREEWGKVADSHFNTNLTQKWETVTQNYKH